MEIQATIVVPDESYLCGCIYEPTGEMRSPILGEYFYNVVEKRVVHFLNEHYLPIHEMPIYRKKQWRATDNEMYFFVRNDGTIDSRADTQRPLDTMLFELGNYFMIKSDAELLAERIKDTIQDFRDEVVL